MDRLSYDKKLGPLLYLFFVSACSSDSTCSLESANSVLESVASLRED